MSWLAAALWKARKNTIKPNTGRVPYKVTAYHKPFKQARAIVAEAVVSGCYHRRLKGPGLRSGT